MTTEESRLDYRDPEWVAERLGLDKSTIYKYLQDGVLPAVRLGRKWLVSEARLAAWLATEEARQTQARVLAADSADAAVARLRNFSAECREILRLAHAEARRYGHEQLGEGHVLLAMLALPDSAAGQVLSLAGIAADPLRREFEGRQPPTDAKLPRRLARTPELTRARHHAAAASRAAGQPEVSAVELLDSIRQAGTGPGWELLRDCGVSAAAWAKAVRRVRQPDLPRRQRRTVKPNQRSKP
jgi:excisionase family DNA binding protein